MFGQKSKPAIPQLDNRGGNRGISAVSPVVRAPSPIRPTDLRRREPAQSAFAAVEGDAVAAPDVAENVPEPVPFEPRREEKRLIVGKGIVLKGEVSACDRLVVEGSVEASLTDSDVVVIAEGGQYKGRAHINEADIAGTFEGTLTAHDRLIVRATGHVIGEIRYGELEVERGGKVSGDIQDAAASEGDTSDVKANQGDTRRDAAPEGAQQPSRVETV